ncbi:MAG: hypothetical protein ABSB56_02340 [Nitrososphaerales archaeon]
MELLTVVELFTVVELLTVVELRVTSGLDVVDVVSVFVWEDPVVRVLLFEVSVEVELPVEVELEVELGLETVDIVETLEEVAVICRKSPEPKVRIAPAPRRPITMRTMISEAYPLFFFIQIHNRHSTDKH